MSADEFLYYRCPNCGLLYVWMPEHVRNGQPPKPCAVCGSLTLIFEPANAPAPARPSDAGIRRAYIEANEQLQALRLALEAAVKTLHVYHGAANWDLYYRNAPELARVRAVLGPEFNL